MVGEGIRRNEDARRLMKSGHDSAARLTAYPENRQGGLCSL